MEIMNVIPSETLIFEDSLCGRTAAYESGAHVIPIVNSLDITVSFLDHCRIYLKRPLSLSKLRIVIPMAGLGSRFQKDDYIIQKPFLPMVRGRQLNSTGSIKVINTKSFNTKAGVGIWHRLETNFLKLNLIYNIFQ